MNIDDMILVSIDDHVIEPRDMFEGHVPDVRRDQAPRSRRERRRASSAGCSRASTGGSGPQRRRAWPKEEWGMDPTTFAEMRPGAYDVHERIRDMNRNGDPGLDVLPDLRRLQRRHLPARRRTRTWRS